MTDWGQRGYRLRPNDGRALTDRAIDRIQTRLYKGIYDDVEMDRVFDSLRVQRKVLGALFKLFQEEPNTRVSIADPIRNSTLAYLKERVSMDDPKKWHD